MRKKHLDVLKRRLLAGDVTWIARQAGKLLGVPASWHLGRALVAPAFGGLVVTYRCNESCPMCHLRLKPGKRQEVGRDEMLSLAGQMADLGVSGVSLTGGEPLLREDVLDVIRLLKARGVPVSMSSNGLRLADPALARELVASGIDSVAISLDGPDAASHDASRGKPGAFDRTLQGIENLLSARREAKAGLYVTLASAVGARNIDAFEGVLAQARRMGVDNVSLNPVHDTYGERDPADPGLYLSLDAREADAVCGKLLDLRERYGNMDSSPGYLRLLSDFFQGRPLPMRCYAPYFSIYVDCYKDLLPCAGYFYEDKPVMSLGQRTLREVWRDPAYAAERAKLKNCRACYYSCMAELNLAYPRRP